MWVWKAETLGLRVLIFLKTGLNFYNTLCCTRVVLAMRVSIRRLRCLKYSYFQKLILNLDRPLTAEEWNEAAIRCYFVHQSSGQPADMTAATYSVLVSKKRCNLCPSVSAFHFTTVLLELLRAHFNKNIRTWMCIKQRNFLQPAFTNWKRGQCRISDKKNWIFCCRYRVKR